MNSTKHLLLIFSLITLLPTPTTAQKKKWNISAIYAFGDSTLDSGNNNGLPTICKCNHRPYARNLPSRVPSGRCSNGWLALDYVISNLGIKKFLPPYADNGMTDEELLKGASFASGCAGLDDVTSVTGGGMMMTVQLRNFQAAFERIRERVGQARAGMVIENALFVIEVGTNDVMYNIYMSPTGRMRDLAEYHKLMLRNLETLVKRLVGLGAVRVAVMGMPPVGCIPLMVTMNSMNSGGKRACSNEQNRDSIAYNKKLQSLVTRLRQTTRKSKIIYGDTYNALLHMIRHPRKYGFNKTIEGCCGSGTLETGPMCNQNSKICRNVNNYVFWDGAHPTQATNKIYAKYFQKRVLSKF